MKIAPFGPGTILLDKSGLPALVTLNLRPSTTSPNRIKTSFTIVDDVGDVVPMPIAEATVSTDGYRPSGITVEGRFELN